MSRKDFVLIAKTIFNASMDSCEKKYIAQELANALRTTNSNFKYDLFVNACLTGAMK